MERYAYTDETGHSGLKLFDSGQDAFWTGTLISYADMDTRYAKYHRELLSLASVKELHGNDLGFGGIEKIAARAVSFIREKNLQFAFSRVHKPHLAATKLFDLVFDSGNNPAVPPLAYGNQQLRLVNTLHFVQLLHEVDAREFWAIFQSQDSARFGAFLAALIPRYEQAPFDARSVQILTGALRWAAEHPEEVLDSFSEGDSPNFVAFCGLFGQLHDLHKQSGDTIGSFVHDEQNQFVPMFERGWTLLTKFEGRNHPMAMISDWQRIESFRCSLVERSSADSFGLQLLDVSLWLLKRVVDKRQEPRGQCATLFNCLVERSRLAHFDLRQLVEQVEVGSAFVETLPFSAADEARAKGLLAQMESARLDRLAAISSSGSGGVNA